MPDNSNTSTQGNRPSEYKTPEDRDKGDAARVKEWKARIRYAAAELGIAKRVKDAKAGDEYLEGKAPAPNAHQIHFAYLPSLLEESHRRTLPAVPAPRVEPRNESASTPIGTTPVIGPDGMPQVDELGQPVTMPSGPTPAELARELVALCFNSPYSSIKGVADKLQWDDARAGVGFCKTTWRADVERAEPLPEYDEAKSAVAVERAEEENENPVLAAITADDIDYIHLDIHRPYLEALELVFPEPPEAAALRAHAEEHEARMVRIKLERPVLERVPWYCFTYDPDVPWERRAWEAEERSIRIRELLRMGYKNINPNNLPAEEKQGDAGALPYEDKTASVYDCHDRITGERWVIPANGPADALPLHTGPWLWGGIDIYLPFVTRPYKPEQLHGLASVSACLPILDELAVVDFYIRRHVETHASYMWGLPKGDNDVKSQLNNPNNRFFDVTPEMAAMGTQEYKPPAIPVSLLQYRETLLGELRRVLGIDAQDTGVSTPHQITATESAHRSQAKSDKTDDRQETMGDLLAAVAKNFLLLYKAFASEAVMVRVLGPDGAQFHRVTKADIPDDLDVFLDIKGESESEKAEQASIAMQVWQISGTAPIPIEWQELYEWVLRRLGVQHPEKFRAEAPEMPGDSMDMPGMPGMASESPTIPFPAGGNQGGPPSPPEQQSFGA